MATANGSSAAPDLVVLAQGLELLGNGVAPAVRPDAAAIGTVDRALGGGKAVDVNAGG